MENDGTMKSILCAAMLLGVANHLPAQQVGSIDLTQPPIHTNGSLPPGCEKLTGGSVGDGWPRPEEVHTRTISVEIMELSDQTPSEGSELIATVLLRNIGSTTFEIPWSQSLSGTDGGEDPKRRSWHAGFFAVYLQRPGENQLPLDSLGRGLIGSKSSPGTLLTIRPGEWITAKIRIELESRTAVPGRELRKGTADLFVEWQEDEVLETIGPGPDCSVGMGYSHITSFYKQELAHTTIQIAATAPPKN
jgi:hypothetical protein